MGVELNIVTNPLDNIFSGIISIVQEGQLRMAPPIIIFDSGELRVLDNATLIFEE